MAEDAPEQMYIEMRRDFESFCRAIGGRLVVEAEEDVYAKLSCLVRGKKLTLECGGRPPSYPFVLVEVSDPEAKSYSQAELRGEFSSRLEHYGVFNFSTLTIRGKNGEYISLYAGTRGENNVLRITVDKAYVKQYIAV